MAYYVFLKSLRSLEEFRKNPHVKIPPKSPSTNFQSLGKLKNPIFNSEILFLISVRPTMWPTRPLSPASPLATPPPQAKTVPAGPSSPHVGRVFTENTSSLWDRAFRAGRLSHVSLSTGPQMSIPSPTSAATDSRPLSAAQLRALGAIEPLPPRLHFPSLNFPP
jgi:hypothetical protein